MKILPTAFAADPERMARFDREARTLAALNHPNIGTIYGVEETNGLRALALEFVEGETLADQVARGPIAIDDALPIAGQIAEALEAAHEHGIIHRDLKPANIKMTPEGVIKVLDFGLAKLADVPDGGRSARSALQSPTITSPAVLTQAGMLLGTAAYMAPEQAKGRPADKRSDIWAFGCVLYEMLTGRCAFASQREETVADVIAAVLKEDPDWRVLPADTSPSVRRLLLRCLCKDVRGRLHDIADARLEIRDAQTGDAELATRAPRTVWLPWTLVGTFAVLSVVLAVLLGRSVTQRPDSAPVYRSLILPPMGNPIAALEARTAVPRFARGLALTRDGKRLAFVAPGADGRGIVWVRPLDATDAQPLAGTEGATSPFWSYDGRQLAFVADRKLKRIDASGGPAVALYDGARPYSRGTWNADNVILFTGDDAILRIFASGGAVSPVTSSSTASLIGTDAAPFFLPDGRRFLYSVGGAIYVGSVGSRETRKLLDGAQLPSYANGFLVFGRGNTLMAQRFNADRQELSGEPVALIHQLQMGGAPSSRATYAVSESGVLAYQGSIDEQSMLVLLDRSGKEFGLLSDSADFSYVHVSPDGRQSAVSVIDNASGNRDLWLYETARMGRVRLTDDPTDDFAAVWSPTADRLVFAARRAGDTDLNLYAKLLSGGGERRLLDREGLEIPTSWSPDGRFILFQTESPASDISVLSLSDAKVLPFANTKFTEASAQFSRDGRWVAYSSNETGRTEVYIAPFGRTGPRVPVSTDGGSSPRWSHDGEELFYIRGDDTLMHVAVSTNESTTEIGPSQALFRTQFRRNAFPYDVGPNGRFLVNRSVRDPGPAPITLVVNWSALLN